MSEKTPKTELARARRSLRKAERSIEHRAELVRARAIARELSETLVDSGEDRLEALEIFRDTWRVEMSALGGHGDLYDRAFREAIQAQEAILSAVSARLGKESLAVAAAMADLGEIHIEHADILSEAALRPFPGLYQKGRELLLRAVRLYERLGDGDSARELREWIEDRTRG